MNMAETLGTAISALILSVIASLILAALVHFITGDNILSVLVLYILVATIPSIEIKSSVSRSAAITGSLIAVVVMFLILNFVFPMIFGPNISFPYSMLGLGPVITGLIASLIIGILSLGLRI